MSRHPVTPMTESDLRIHLARQTTQPIHHLSSTAPIPSTAPPPGLLLCDLHSPGQYAPLGQMLDRLAGHGPCFSIGSSGLAACLGAHWQHTGLISPRDQWPTLDPAGPVLVASGSCSPVTERQIATALVAGFIEVPLSENAAPTCAAHLAAGHHVILHTARGPGDPRLTTGILPGHETGTALGHTVREILTLHPALRRLIFCGGDTSSHAIATLGIHSLEMHRPLTPGAPLCRAGDLEIICKGGQAGPDDFLLRATPTPPSP